MNKIDNSIKDVSNRIFVSNDAHNMSFYHSRHDGTQEEQKCPPVDYSFIYLYANNIYYPFTYTRRFRLKHLSAAVSNVPPQKLPKLLLSLLFFSFPPSAPLWGKKIGKRFGDDEEMRYLCARILVLILILFEMDKDKVEKASVAAIEKYLLPCSLIKSFINTNDKTPFWDGDLFVYKKDDQKGNVKDNFHGRVPIQVKGRSDNSTNFTISRAEANAYMNDGGCLFFKVLVNEDFSTKILTAFLSKETLKNHLQDGGDSIKIQLDEATDDPLVFQEKVYDFVISRNKETNEKSSPKEIADLVEGFEEIREFLGEIEDNEAKYELESLLDSIKNTKDNGTIGWRDKFIYYSRKALDLAISNLKGVDSANLQFKLGAYLHKQKLYHMVEEIYMKALEGRRIRAEVLPIPPFINDVATSLNYLGYLHRILARYDEAEQEYQEALRIRRELAETDRSTYIGDVAFTLNSLAILHTTLNRYEVAESEIMEALNYYRELAVVNRDAYIWDVAKTLNNMGNIHRDLTRYDEAEQEYQEALQIRRELAKNDREAYIEFVAETLNNLGNLYRDLTLHNKAEQEYKEALEIRRELAHTNPGAYMADVAGTLNNLAVLHYALTHYDEAEQEYREALEIRRELAKNNRNAYIRDVAKTLNNMVALHIAINRYEWAEMECREALEILRELARINRNAYIEDVAMTLNNLGHLHYDSKRYEEAEHEVRESLRYFRELAETKCNFHPENLAATLLGLSILLQRDRNQLVDARDAAKEALGIYKELAKKYPQIWNEYVENTQRLLDELNDVEK